MLNNILMDKIVLSKWFKIFILVISACISGFLLFCCGSLITGIIRWPYDSGDDYLWYLLILYIIVTTLFMTLFIKYVLPTLNNNDDNNKIII